MTFPAQATTPRLWPAADSVIQTVKDPQSDENFVIDWTAVLNGDTIANSVWNIPPDLSYSRQVILSAGTMTQTGLAFGQLGQSYYVSNVVLLTTTKQTLVQNLLITIQAA
jgi:hypothetical protein